MTGAEPNQGLVCLPGMGVVEGPNFSSSVVKSGWQYLPLAGPRAVLSFFFL